MLYFYKNRWKVKAKIISGCIQYVRFHQVWPLWYTHSIHSSAQDVIDTETNRHQLFPFTPFRLGYYLMENGSIQPLHPLVAVAHFLTEKKV